MKMKKIMATVTATVLAASLLATGCGDGNKKSSSNGGTILYQVQLHLQSGTTI